MFQSTDSTLFSFIIVFGRHNFNCIISLPSDFFFLKSAVYRFSFAYSASHKILFLVYLVHFPRLFICFQPLSVHTPRSVLIQTFKEINLLITAIRLCRLHLYSKLSNRWLRTRYMKCPLTIYKSFLKNISDGTQSWRYALAPSSTTWNSRPTCPLLPSNFAPPTSSSSS